MRVRAPDGRPSTGPSGTLPSANSHFLPQGSQLNHVCKQWTNGSIPDPGDPQLAGPCQQGKGCWDFRNACIYSAVLVIALALHLTNQCSTTEPQNPAPTIKFNVSSQGSGDVGEEESRDGTGERVQWGERLDDLSLVPRTPWKQITSLGVLRLSSDLPCTHKK